MPPSLPAERKPVHTASRKAQAGHPFRMGNATHALGSHLTYTRLAGTLLTYLWCSGGGLGCWCFHGPRDVQACSVPHRSSAMHIQQYRIRLAGEAFDALPRCLVHS